MQIEPVSVLSLTSVAVIASAAIGYGVLKNKVEIHSERLNALDDAIQQRVTREEFDLVLKKLQELHQDVREIRGRL